MSGSTVDRLGRIGVFLGRLGQLPAAELRRAAAELERLGYGALWVGEAFGREAFTAAGLVLGATENIAVCTGIANIWVRDAAAMANAARTLEEAYPDRFVLGIGVSHPPLVGPRGHSYGRPLTAMREYLRAMAAARYAGPQPADEPPLLLAALGPRMLQLAGESAAGAFTYFVPVAHTSRARTALGPAQMLAVEQAVVRATDRPDARRVADAYVAAYLRLDNYRNNLLRLGWQDADVVGSGTDRLFDELIAWGDRDGFAQRVREHFDAGADHVALQAVTEDASRLALPLLRDIAADLVR